MEWQLKKYADERMHGKNIDGLTVEEKRELKSMMIRDLYPGKNYFSFKYDSGILFLK